MNNEGLSRVVGIFYFETSSGITKLPKENKCDNTTDPSFLRLKG